MRKIAIEDDAAKDDTLPPLRYVISSYGADYPVDSLVKRLKNGDIYIPRFQRGYVWNQKQASRFIESLLLGLPVPGVFLGKDYETKKLFVIDGQQRLSTLRFFYEGFIGVEKKRPFVLKGVDKRFEGKTYRDLDEEDRRTLDDSIIHATIVRQEEPPEEDSSIYFIFERINTGGTPLQPQEIRTSVYYGKLVEALEELNSFEPWRRIFGPKHKRMKDRELILRFLALYYHRDKYQRPFKDFLNKFMSKHRNDEESIEKYKDIFQKSIKLAYEAFGERAFRLEKTFNAAIYDSVLYAVARLRLFDFDDVRRIGTCYQRLLGDKEYLDLVSRSTADEKRVIGRLDRAVDVFEECLNLR